MVSRQKKALYIVMTAIFLCFMLSYTVYYMRLSGKLSYKKWDMDIVTASDFTV